MSIVMNHNINTGAKLSFLPPAIQKWNTTSKNKKKKIETQYSSEIYRNAGSKPSFREVFLRNLADTNMQTDNNLN